MNSEDIMLGDKLTLVYGSRKCEAIVIGRIVCRYFNPNDKTSFLLKLNLPKDTKDGFHESAIWYHGADAEPDGFKPWLDQKPSAFLMEYERQTFVSIWSNNFTGIIEFKDPIKIIEAQIRNEIGL